MLVSDVVLLALQEPVPVELDEGVPVWLPVPVELLEPVPVELDEGVPVWLPVPVPVALLEGVPDADGVPVPVVEAVPVELLDPVPVPLDDGVCDGVPLDDGVCDGVPLDDGVPDGVRDGVGSKHSVPALPEQSTAMLMTYAHMLGSVTAAAMRTTPSLEHEKRSVVERGVAPHASPPV